MNPPPDTGAESASTGPDPASFVALISGLAAQAQIFLGALANPLTGKYEDRDLVRTRILIDTLEMLSTKTDGNLTAQESQFQDRVLADLRMRYVQAFAESGEAGDESAG